MPTMQSSRRARLMALPLAAAAFAATMGAATPSARAVVEDAPVQVGYDKGFFIQDPEGDFKITFGARLQLRLLYEFLEGKADKFHFVVPRARFGVKGNLFGQDLTYKLELDFSKGEANLLDFWADYRVVKGWFHVRAGQMKTPFARQNITSSGKLEFADSAFLNKAFVADRDLGLMFHNGYEKSPEIEYAVGVFNGVSSVKGAYTFDATKGTVSRSNTPGQFEPRLVARVGYNFGGVQGYGYDEPDLKNSPFGFGVAGAVMVDFDADDDNDGFVNAELDWIMKVQGFSWNGAVFFGFPQSGANISKVSFGMWGLQTQLGYAIKKLFEPVVRFAMLDPKGSKNNTYHALAGIAFYLYGHNVKIHLEGGPVITEVGGSTTIDGLAQTQLQLQF